jgi:hypothetical protein
MRRYSRATGRPSVIIAVSGPTKDIRGGSGKGGAVTLHDLRPSAITNRSEKGITAAHASTHLTADMFARYIPRDLNERRNTAKIIEG